MASLTSENQSVEYEGVVDGVLENELNGCLTTYKYRC